MRRDWIRFDRNELAGAFGDIGTDLPLVVGLILAAKLDAASALIMFGAMQMLTGFVYGMPMPVQPLKAMAAIVIAQKLAGDVLFGGGLAIGVIMFVLTVTGLIGWLARVVPKTVVRGIQFGLGLQLAMLAIKDYVQADGAAGYVLAAVGALITIVLMGNRRFPAALFVIALGVAYATFAHLDLARINVGFRLPQVHVPAWDAILKGLIVLTIPQIPLSLGNSILATRQVAEDLFPERKLTIPKISLTYSLMNLVSPWFGGIPTCHGSGGMAGHYTFGGRTGGSVVLYGSLYLVLGLFFSGCFNQLIQVFPKPILGVMLAFEGLAMLLLVRDIASSRRDFLIAALTGLLCVGLPYGYAVGLITGTALVYLWHGETGHRANT
jgi:MFS superfamily sulfate permease-like transporter